MSFLQSRKAVMYRMYLQGRHCPLPLQIMEFNFWCKTKDTKLPSFYQNLWKLLAGVCCKLPLACVQNTHIVKCNTIWKIITFLASCWLCHLQLCLVFLYSSRVCIYTIYCVCFPHWGSRYGPPVRTQYRVIVENMSSRTSWQVITVL